MALGQSLRLCTETAFGSTAEMLVRIGSMNHLKDRVQICPKEHLPARRCLKTPQEAMQHLVVHGEGVNPPDSDGMFPLPVMKLYHCREARTTSGVQTGVGEDPSDIVTLCQDALFREHIIVLLRNLLRTFCFSLSCYMFPFFRLLFPSA